MLANVAHSSTGWDRADERSTSAALVSKLYYQRRSTEAFDVDRYYREHYKRMQRFLPRFQRVPIGDPASARVDGDLAPTALISS